MGAAVGVGAGSGVAAGAAGAGAAPAGAGTTAGTAGAGAGIIIRGGVARGEPGDGLGAEDRWRLFTKAGLDELRAPDETRTAFLLRFTLSHPHCHTTIVGTANREHLQQNVATALRGPLPPDLYAEAKARLDAAGERPVEDV